LWQNVLDQLRFDIELLKECENTKIRITTRRTNMITRLEEYNTLPEYADTILPDAYVKPYEHACKKIRTQFGELTEVEFKFVFSVIKKYFVKLIRLYKTYASFEGKNGQGLCGMSSLVWGICCKAMDLPKLSEDDAQDFIYDIFKLSSVQTMDASRHSVEVATLRAKTQKLMGEVKEDSGITGVWQCGKTNTRLWTLETKLGGVFTGCIGTAKYATIEGKIGEKGEHTLTIAYGKDSNRSRLTVKCKAKQVDGATIRVWCKMSNGEKGYWVLKKTGAKVRTQNKGFIALCYDNFVEAIIRLSIYIWTDIPAWEAIEALMVEHLPRALSKWDVVPESNGTVQQYFKEREVKSILASIYNAHSLSRRDKKKGKLLNYPKWEELVRKISRSASGSFESASFRTMQFSFFASKEMFPNDGPLNELTFAEFKCAVARLAFMMVVGYKSRHSVLGPKPQLSNQCKDMITWLKDVKKYR